MDTCGTWAHWVWTFSSHSPSLARPNFPQTPFWRWCWTCGAADGSLVDRWSLAAYSVCWPLKCRWVSPVTSKFLILDFPNFLWILIRLIHSLSMQSKFLPSQKSFLILLILPFLDFGIRILVHIFNFLIWSRYSFGCAGNYGPICCQYLVQYWTAVCRWITTNGC